MLKINQQVLIPRPESVRSLYDRYAGMLLGYIFEVVKDRKLAEEYLVSIFCEISQQFNEVNWEASNHWCVLQRFAKKKLVTFTGSIARDRTFSSRELLSNRPYSKGLEKLDEAQKQVFCEVYYHGSTIAAISKKLNQTEDSIRKSLKEAFAIMRKGVEN